MHANVKVRPVTSWAVVNVYHHWESWSRLPDTLTLLANDGNWDFSILKCSGNSSFWIGASWPSFPGHSHIWRLQLSFSWYLWLKLSTAKSRGEPFSLHAYASSAIYSPSRPCSLTSILLSRRKWIVICFWGHSLFPCRFKNDFTKLKFGITSRCISFDSNLWA